MKLDLQPPGPGVYFDVPFDEYLRWNAFSKSMATPLLRSGQHFKHYLEEGFRSKSIQIGSVADCLILEPGKFSEYFVMLPDTYENSKGATMPFNLHSKTCREIKKTLEESGKDVIKTDLYFQAKEISENVMSHNCAAGMLATGKKQVSLSWIDDVTGVPCKARPDNLRSDAIDDLKTTKSAEKQSFSRDMVNFGYDIQGALYTDGVTATCEGVVLPFNLIAVENTAPYAVCCYGVGEDTLLTGRAKYRKAQRIWKTIVDTGVYPGYSDFIEPIDIPAWALNTELGEDVTDGI